MVNFSIIRGLAERWPKPHEALVGISLGRGAEILDEARLGLALIFGELRRLLRVRAEVQYSPELLARLVAKPESQVAVREIKHGAGIFRIMLQTIFQQLHGAALVAPQKEWRAEINPGQETLASRLFIIGVKAYHRLHFFPNITHPQQAPQVSV